MFNVDVFTISVASDIRECVRESVCVRVVWVANWLLPRVHFYVRKHCAGEKSAVHTAQTFR